MKGSEGETKALEQDDKKSIKRPRSFLNTVFESIPCMPSTPQASNVSVLFGERVCSAQSRGSPTAPHSSSFGMEIVGYLVHINFATVYSLGLTKP